MPNQFPIHRPVNVMQNIIMEFLDGAPFTEQLCDKVVATYCTDFTGASYKRNLEFVKSVIDRAKRYHIGNNIYAVETEFEFNDLEIALVVRLLNLCYHGERILTLNNSIIYIPKELHNYTEEEIRIHVFKSIQNKKPGRMRQFFGRLKAKVQSKHSHKLVTVGTHIASV